MRHCCTHIKKPPVIMPGVCKGVLNNEKLGAANRLRSHTRTVWISVELEGTCVPLIYFFLSFLTFLLTFFFSLSSMSTDETLVRANDAFFDDDYDEALALYTQVIQNNPDNAEAVMRR